jgi:prefoldin subunit 5
MDDPFALLDEKVKKAAELVRRLRREKEDLQQEQGQLRSRLLEAERSLQALEKGKTAAADEARKVESLGREVKVLRGEREEVRQRIARLLEVLDGIE